MKHKCHICGKECTNIYLKLEGGKQSGPLCVEHLEILTKPTDAIGMDLEAAIDFIKQNKRNQTKDCLFFDCDLSEKGIPCGSDCPSYAYHEDKDSGK